MAPGSEEWVADCASVMRQLWLNLFVLSVHHPQVDIRFTFCAFFSTGS